jgi:DnaJ-class molecular chaperone
MTTTSADKLAELAAIEDDCVCLEACITPGCTACDEHGCVECEKTRPNHSSTCENCKGTGKVARWPSLRMECEICDGGRWYKAHAHYTPGEDCEGRGWLTRPLGLIDLQALLKEVRGKGYAYQMMADGQRDTPVWFGLLPKGDLYIPKRFEADTETEAVIKALYEAEL